MLSLILSIYITSGPLLESYQIGIGIANGDFISMLKSVTTRPLSILPSGLATYLGGTNPLTFFMINVILLLIRLNYANKFKLINKSSGTAEIFFLGFLPPSFIIFNERFGAAALASTFMIIHVYYFLNSKRFFTTILFYLLAVLAYPPIILVSIFLLLLIKIEFKHIYFPKLKFIYISITSLFIYLVFLFTAPSFSPTNYDQVSVTDIKVEYLFRIYHTVFLKSIFFTLGYLICFILIFFHTRYRMNKLASTKFILLFALTPLVSLPYITNGLHVNDPERIFFPISIFLALLIVITNDHSFKSKFFIQIFGFVFLLTLIVFKVMYWVEIRSSNERLIKTVSEIFSTQTGSESILVFDETAYYGDVYTLYEDVSLLESIVNQEFLNKKLAICTLSESGKQKFVANVFPINSTKLCQEFKINDFDLILRINNDNWLLVRNNIVIETY